MKKKILLAFIVMITIVLAGCSSNNNNNDTNKESNDINVVINKMDGVDIKYDYTKGNDLLLTIKNKNNINLSMALFDNDNKLIKTENRYLYDNMNAVYKIYVSDIFKKIKRIEMTPTKITNYQKYQHYESSIKLDYNVDNDTKKIIVTINNTSGEIIDNVAYSIYFYKNNKLIDILNYTNSNIENIYNQEIYMPSYKTKNGTYKVIDYDKIEVKVDSAIKYVDNQ